MTKKLFEVQLTCSPEHVDSPGGVADVLELLPDDLVAALAHPKEVTALIRGELALLADDAF